jgi:hypothetical protein
MCISELNSALQRANKVLTDEGLASVPLLKYDQKFAVGTPVATKYGNGIVTRFRANDGMNEVLTPMNASPSLHFSSIKFHKIYARNSALKRLEYLKAPIGNIPTILGPGKSMNLDRIRELKSKESSFAAKKFDPVKYAVTKLDDLIGAFVWTSFGIGKISSFRNSDQIFTVNLQIGAVLYSSPSTLVRISDIPGSYSWQIVPTINSTNAATSTRSSTAVTSVTSTASAIGGGSA